MRTQQLLAQYERIVDAPDAVSQLRRFIIELAVRGQLLDSSGSVWDEKPIHECLEELPDGRVIHQGWSPQCEKHPTRNDTVWGVLKTTAVQDGFYLSAENKELPTALAPKPHLEVRPGDILITCAGPRARCGIPCLVESTPRRLLISGKMYRFRADEKIISSRYLLLFLRSEKAQAAIDAMKTGSSESGVNLTQDRFRKLLVEFGSVSEQDRIVAKVAELMALCDRFEAAITKREVARHELAGVIFARLGLSDASSFRADTQQALENLDRLTEHADQVQALRQTLLNLAVRGRLVPQDANDEPVERLLMHIAACKADRKRRTADHRIGADASPKRDEFPILLPKGWAVESFANLFLFIDYRGKTPAKSDSGVPLITAKNIRMGYLNREPREYISAKTFETWMTRGFPKVGDLLFTTEAPLANVCLNDMKEPFALAQRVICLQPYAEIDTKFFMFALMSEPMQALIGAQATGLTAKGIKAAKLKPLPIPVPPLAEQRRIVAKVDELMALTDRLERQLAERATLRSRLFAALVRDASVAA